MTPKNCDLQVRISQLTDLPVRDDTGVFVCGMLQIQSLRLQGIEISHLLANTMFGTDSVITLPMTNPIYSWMVKNQSSILPNVFNLPVMQLFADK
jgi:hypothetical protein